MKKQNEIIKLRKIPHEIRNVRALHRRKVLRAKYFHSSGVSKNNNFLCFIVKQCCGLFKHNMYIYLLIKIHNRNSDFHFTSTRLCSEVYFINKKDFYATRALNMLWFFFISAESEKNSAFIYFKAKCQTNLFGCDINKKKIN